MRAKKLFAIAIIALFAFTLSSTMLSNAATTVQPSDPSAMIITYSIPIQFAIIGNATVPANSTSSVNFTLPYKLSANATVTFYYKLMDANGTLLSNASGISINLLDSDTNQSLTTVYLAAGSPAEAIVPLSAVPESTNLSATITNTLSSNVTAQLQLIVVDTAKFNVQLSTEQVKVAPGENATVIVKIKQISGPAGKLFLDANFNNSDIVSSIVPDQVNTNAGGEYSFNWYIHVNDKISPGVYKGVLTGTFVPQQIPGRLAAQQYTFAEVMFPLVVGAAAGGGLLAGSIMGATMGWWAVAIAILLILIGAVILFKI